MEERDIYCVDTQAFLDTNGDGLLYLHRVGPDQERFVETFGRDVLPRLP
ncbi:MAG: hypothetical protein ABIW50_01370 [Candidatus Limnocylindria bacterium]